MRRRILLGLMAAVLPVVVGTAVADEGLWEKFLHPSDDVRTKVWWFHGETETTEAGLRADLEALRAAGVGGVVWYDQVHGAASGACAAMSPEWWSAIKYAARVASELGLTFEVAASNGYVGGGPWITPDLGMQELAVVDTVVTLAEADVVEVAIGHPSPHFKPVATLVWPDSAEWQEITMRRERLTLDSGQTARIDYDAGREVRIGAITYQTNPRGKGSTGSMNVPGPPGPRYFGAGYVPLPPLGRLEYSLDGREWRVATPLAAVENVIGRKSRERTISFPSVVGRYFRVCLDGWMDAEGRYKTMWIEAVRLSTRDVVDNWQVKSGLRTEVTYRHAEGGSRGAINPAALRDVTNQVGADGVLRTTLDAGTWHVLRVGHVPTGARTKHGRRNLLGLEADVMSAEAARVHYDNYFHRICDTLSAIGLRPAGMCMDSHEAGVQNWTPGFDVRFAAQRGYDIVPWLPALAGYIVEGRAATERFLTDYRRTVAETIATQFYGTLARLCHADSVTFTSQAMLNILNDNIMSRGMADRPQGEFWAYQKDGNYDCLDAASSAHLYGHPIASAEAFTDTPYDATWDELLRLACLAYCRGINELVVCASSYQPWLDRKYDDAASQHPYVFHRWHPAWGSVRPFWDYQARCATLLRQGEPVVDLCVYIGDDLPAKTYAFRLPDVPQGYNFDVASTDALLHRLSARGGELVAEGGMSYRALVVEDGISLSAEAESRLKELARAGVPVVRCDRGESVVVSLAEAAIRPDLAAVSADQPSDRLCFFHRRTPEADIYFVYNHSPRAYDAPMTLRTPYTHAEAWSPHDASRRQLTMSSDGTVRLSLAPHEAAFIVVGVSPF